MTEAQPSYENPAWQRALVRGLAAVVCGLVLGTLAALPQAFGVFLVGIQSLAAGAALGVLLIGSVAIVSSGLPRWPSAVLAACVAIAVQHYSLYWMTIQKRQQAAIEQPAIELFRPGWSEQSFWQFMASEANTRSVALWVLDADLLAVAAVVIVEYNARRRAGSSTLREPSS